MSILQHHSSKTYRYLKNTLIARTTCSGELCQNEKLFTKNSLMQTLDYIK